MLEVISLHRELLNDFLIVEVWQEVEDVLQVMNNVSIHGKLSPEHLINVGFHVLNLCHQGLEAKDLVLNLLREVSHRNILDVSQQMLNSNLFSLSSIDGAWDMDEVLDQLLSQGAATLLTLTGA